MNEPVGADVYFKDYNDVDGAWLLVGRVPITGARVPMGELRWRLVKDGFDTAEGASAIGPVITLRRTGEAPAGMVYVRGGRSSDQTRTVQLPDYWMDRYEVTNREFKRFVDAGGYRDRKYWGASFDVVERFRDRTGRPGPATWELGTFPEGQADYPVSGVSWYRPRHTPSSPISGCRPFSTGGTRSGTCCSATRLRRWRISTANRPNRRPSSKISARTARTAWRAT